MLPDLSAAQAQETSGLRPEEVANQSASSATWPQSQAQDRTQGDPGMLLENFFREAGGVALD